MPHWKRPAPISVDYNRNVHLVSVVSEQIDLVAVVESASDADGTKIAIGPRSAIVNNVENVAKHEANAEAIQIGARSAIVNDAKKVA